jgi:Tol biopolymer transport system component
MGATGESVTRLTDFGFNPPWSPDGREIVFASNGVFSHQAAAANSRLWIVDIETKEAMPLTDEGISLAFQPSWSPSGQRIAYWSFEGGQRDIWTIPAEGGDPVRVTQSESIDWNPVWSPGGRFIYFSSDRGGTMGIWRVPVDERTGTVQGESRLLTSSLSDVTGHLSIGRDGKRVAYAVMSMPRNLQKITLDPSKEKFVGEPEWITNATAPGFTEPAPSPDGEWVAFVMSGRWRGS